MMFAAIQQRLVVERWPVLQPGALGVLQQWYVRQGRRAVEGGAVQSTLPRP